jgi:peptide/nickel transport system substrate-binding protein
MALNRDGLNTVLYGGAGMPSVAPVPADSPYVEGADFAEFDLDGAKALLAEYGEPISLTLLSTESRTQPAELVQQMWGQAGIDVTIEIVDQAQLIDRVLSNPDYQLAMWTGDEVANPSKMSLRYVSTGAVNTAGYANDAVDAAFAEAATIADTDRITELYQEIMGHVAADVPYIYLVRKVGVIVHTPDVVGVALAPVAGVQVVDPRTLSLAG